MDNPTVLVIGAGIGGIVTAARLAKQGYQVTVVEKCERTGGRCDRFVVDGYHFDTGPTLFLMPDIYTQTFAELGERMEDHLDLVRIDPSYRIHFDDGTKLDLSSDMIAMQAQLEAIEPGSFNGYLHYLDEACHFYNLTLANIVERNFNSLGEYFSINNLLLLFKLRGLTKHYDFVGKFFKDPRLKIAFTFQDLYLGLSPYNAPATYSLLQYTEAAEGVWLPVGGMYRVIEALTGIAEGLGSEFLLNTCVSKINIHGSRATGVTLEDGSQIHADIVVANADLPYVYRHLLPKDGMVDRLERKQYSFSTLMFYWGLDKQYPQIKPHNLFLASDHRQSFDRIFKDLSLPDEPSFYLHAPVRVDPSLAPEGHEILISIVPIGHIDETAPQDWTPLQERARLYVLKRLAGIGARDVEGNIRSEVIFNPTDWQNRYNLTKGSPHGLSYVFSQVGYLRPHNRHHRYRNLYFVGASTHPGTGLPIVLISARLTTERILNDAGMRQARLSQ
jgi:phytoene desaturase